MGENALKIGAKLENWGSNLFSDFQWTEIARDVEIKCNRKSTHHTPTHGIDLLCCFSDPYSKMHQGVIVECKNREMRSINKTELNKWIEDLQKSIECAHAAPELEKYMKDDLEISTGLLLIHANDSFESRRMQKYLSGASLKMKRTKMSIYVATNRHIDIWQSLLQYVKNVQGEFFFVYPSINESMICEKKQITLNYLFSQFLFSEVITQEQKNGTNGLPVTQSVRTRIMFCLCKPNISTFQYMWSMFKHFQFGGNADDKYRFVFYPHTSSDVDFVKSQFINSLSSGIEHPLKDQDQSKVEICFLLNRHLSPVDN